MPTTSGAPKKSTVTWTTEGVMEPILVQIIGVGVNAFIHDGEGQCAGERAARAVPAGVSDRRCSGLSRVKSRVKGDTLPGFV